MTRGGHHAYAALGPDPSEATKKVPMLWFFSVALDHAKLANAKPDKLDDDLKCDLQFDVAMGDKGLPAGKGSPVGQAAPVSKGASGAAAKSWGTALPAGGGEPGKAYFAMHRATLAGDVNAMLALATKARAEEMRKARNQPEFPQMLGMIKAFEPAQVRILSGRADGNRAELEIDGKTSDGATMTGEVNLIREEGIWRIEKVSTESKSSDH